MSNAERLALVIGMDYYEHLPHLPSCKKDAEDMCRVLRELKYTLYGNSPLIGSELISEDPEHGFISLQDTIWRFFTEGGPNQLLVFYFSGHGIFAHNENFLATPFVIDPENPDPHRAISFVELTKQMEHCLSTQIVGIIDACYSGGMDVPSSREKDGSRKSKIKLAKSSYNRTLKKMRKNYELLLSSQFFEPSAADESDNSRYTKALLKGLEGVVPQTGKDGTPIQGTGSIDEHGNVTPYSLHEFIIKELGVIHGQNPEHKRATSESIVLACYLDRVKQGRIYNLIQQLNNPNLAHHNRQLIGDQLVESGDTRPGVGLSDDGLPDILWKPILSGQVSIKVSSQTLPHQVEEHVAPFLMSTYPITVAQYKSFLKKGAVASERCWKGLRRTPYNQMEEKISNQQANHPVTNISWHEAMAYCRWLTEEKRGKSQEHKELSERPFIIGENSLIRLPTVWEWIIAATSGNSENIYPWGTLKDTERANTAESKLGHIISVGMYPHGKTRDGVMDMLGNVSEWCLNQFDEARHNPFNNTGHIPEDAFRVVMGGSCITNLDAEREMFAMNWHLSFSYNDFRGFRIVCVENPDKK